MSAAAKNTIRRTRTLVTKKIRRSLLSHLSILKTRRRNGTVAFKKVATRYLKPF